MKTLAPALELSYTQYTAVLASFDGQELAFSLPGPLAKFVAQLKDTVDQIVKTTGANIKDVIRALATRNVYALFKSLKFSLTLIYKGFEKLASIGPKMVLNACEKLHSSKLLVMLRSGTAKLDQVLDQFPILKRLTGLALAAFLLWVWINMTFVGNPLMDFDMTNIAAAMSGSYTLEDLLLSPAALQMFAFLATGFLGLTVTYMATNIGNVFVAILVTATKMARQSGLFRELKAIMPLVRQ